jgi:hypothetical protein
MLLEWLIDTFPDAAPAPARPTMRLITCRGCASRIQMGDEGVRVLGLMYHPQCVPSSSSNNKNGDGVASVAGSGGGTRRKPSMRKRKSDLGDLQLPEGSMNKGVKQTSGSSPRSPELMIEMTVDESSDGDLCE